MNPTMVITGAAGVLGRALAAHASALGWHLVLTGRRTDRLEALAAELPGGAELVAGDVRDPSHLQAVAEAARRSGPVVGVVAAAGLREGAGDQAADPATYARCRVRTHVLGAWGAATVLGPVVHRGGLVVLTGAEAPPVDGSPTWGALAAAEAAAMRHLVGTMTVHHKAAGVRVQGLLAGPEAEGRTARAVGLIDWWIRGAGRRCSGDAVVLR